jgi:prepilin-type N-terminal cleavage/methylation domain-containing protein
MATRPSPPSCPARAGFSLLEVVIVLLIVTILSALAAQALSAGTRLNDRITVQNDLTTQANRVLNEMALELRTVNAEPDFLKLPVPIGGDVDCASDTVVYKYKTSIGIAPKKDVIEGVEHESFHTLYETGFHKLVYNQTTGTLTRKECDQYGAVIASRQFCDKITPPSTSLPEGGFLITKIGNTLSMRLQIQTVFRSGADEETIVQTSQAQVLFLRSTLNSYTGSCPYTDYAEGAPTGGTLTTTGPQILFGNALNYAPNAPTALPGTFNATVSQIVIYIQPPVGRDLYTAAIAVNVSTDYETGTTGNPPSAVFATNTQSVANGSAISFSYSLKPYYTDLLRTDRSATSGCYVITLQGVIAQPINVTVSAATVGGATTTSSKLY